jgi:hypothetical protein
MNHLTVMVHLKPPVAHGYLPNFFREYSEVAHMVRDLFLNPTIKSATRLVAPLRRSQHGTITPITNWPDYGDHELAALRRSRFGTIAPIINKAEALYMYRTQPEFQS